MQAGEPVDYRFNEGINSAGEPAAGPAEATATVDAHEAGPRLEGGCTRRREPAAVPAPRKTRGDAEQAGADRRCSAAKK